jgi:hypothetical protein
VSTIFRLIGGNKGVFRHGPNRLEKGLLKSFFCENRREKAIRNCILKPVLNGMWVERKSVFSGKRLPYRRSYARNVIGNLS